MKKKTKCTDYRIGNFITHNVFGECQIYASDTDSICIQRNDEDIKEWFCFSEFNPILINTYWLIKLGFKKFKGNNDDFFLNDFETSCNRKLWFWKGNEIKNLEYVHELQNLYFAITSKELIHPLTDR